jgi:adenylate cyclase
MNAHQSPCTFDDTSSIIRALGTHAGGRQLPANLALDAQSHPFAGCVISDAEGFTEVTEGMDPREVVELVRQYFNALFAPVFRHGGRVIDVKGDGILAVWTDYTTPADLRSRVCSACVDMAKAVEAFNAEHPQRRLPTRIGADIGAIAIADLGALACLQSRAVGDPVVSASRLEQLNKTLHTRILVSASVAEGVISHHFRDRGLLDLRGKRFPMRVFELIGEAKRSTGNERRHSVPVCL